MHVLCHRGGCDALTATYSWTDLEATLLQTASCYSVQRGKKKKKEKKTHLTSGKTFLMVRLSSQHALTTNYIPYMFYEMLLLSHGSLKKNKNK